MPIEPVFPHGHTAPLQGFAWVTNPITIPPIDLVKISITWPAQQESNLRPKDFGL